MTVRCASTDKLCDPWTLPGQGAGEGAGRAQAGEEPLRVQSGPEGGAWEEWVTYNPLHVHGCVWAQAEDTQVTYTLATLSRDTPRRRLCGQRWKQEAVR